jgi:hypothetical protein
MASHWIEMSEPGLEAALRDLGPRLDYPPSEQISFVVRQRLERAPTPVRRRMRWPKTGLGDLLRPVFVPAWQRVAVALVVLVALLSGVLALSPGARKAVAGWLGLRGVKIEVVPSLSPPPPPALGRNLVLGVPVTLPEARASVPFRILLPSAQGLNQPDEIDLITSFGTGRVSLLYRARPGFPPATATGVGLLLTEFEAAPDQSFIEKKLLPSGTKLVAVKVNGEPGFWIEGAHELYYVRPDGTPIQDTVRLAGNVLLWQHGSVTLRIEANITMAEALAIAESVA